MASKPTYNELKRRIRELERELKDREEQILRLESRKIDLEKILEGFRRTPTTRDEGKGIRAQKGQFLRQVEERKRAEEINRVLFRISNAVNTTKDLKHLYASIHHILGQIIDTTNFYIALYDGEKRTLAFSYWRDEVDRSFRDLVVDYKVSDSLTGQVILDGKPVLLRRRELLERKAQGRMQGVPPLVWLGVPLIADEKVIGVMAVQSYRDPDLFDDRDLEVMASVSEQVALAIDRKRSQEALVRSETRFREIADLLPTVLCEIDPDFHVTYINRIGSEIFGIHPHDLGRGLSVKDFFHPDDSERGEELLEKMIQGIPIKGEEFRFKKKGGEAIWALVYSSPILRDKQVAGVRINLMDITLKKRLETQLERTRKMETVATLSGGIAHDFNNILNAIMGNVSLALAISPPGGEISKYLASAEKSSLSAKRLVERFIKLTEMGAPTKETLSLKTLILDSSALANRDADIRFELSIPGDLYEVEIDRTQISQVLDALITNAKEAMPGGGLIRIKAENLEDSSEEPALEWLPKGRYVKISIQDQGIGIPAEYLSLIFDPYFSTKERGTRKGMGLGLSIAYSFVRKHGGHIHVESQVNEGSTFAIYLPAASPTDRRKARGSRQ
ncbi:MAG: GAF domain-containing protein [Deltaproteobacteria bacterium]|nr:GAF domain-containing protein [Deltaproteobacteria bacterium]